MGLNPNRDAAHAGKEAMASIFLLEPASSPKRHYLAEILSEPKKPILPLAEEAKQRLKEIRSSSIGQVDAMSRQLAEQLQQDSRAKVSFATDVKDALETIEGVCGDTRTIVINKSAIVGKELRPALADAGYEVVDSYREEFQPFENRFTSYWQLPDIPLSSTVESFTRPQDMMEMRRRAVTSQGVKNFVALLGVSAISAADGSAFFFQHAHNISKTFRQAKKLIIVAGLDKLASSREDALLQTRYMAIFGAEARLLDLRIQDKKEPVLESMPFEPPQIEAEEVHFIIFDNGRRRILQGSYKELFPCMGCRACIKDCPTYQFFGGEYEWNPREYLYFYLQGSHHSLDLCLSCGMCRVNCPLDIDIPDMILEAKSARAGWSPSTALMMNFPEQVKAGYLMPQVTNAVMGNRQLLWIAEKLFGVSKERQLPLLADVPLDRWFRGRRRRGR